MATRRVRDPQVFADEAAAACERLLGQKAINVDWPASRSRRSVRVHLEDQTVIATRRKRRERSMLEANVLKTLHEHGAAVPAVHAYDGVGLIQEYLAGERLPHVLMNCDPARAHELLSSAASGLAQIHEIGAETELHGNVVRYPRWTWSSD
ncbi:MAG: phosphotransferase [Rhodospirillaceae bacterium]|nr:phosphotransferase [Rhodospirillaceae bacterium]